MLRQSRVNTSLLLLPVLFTVCCGSHAAAIRKLPSVAFDSLVCPLPTNGATKLVTLGYDRLFSDILWLRFVQLVGDRATYEHQNSVPFEELLERITLLDPHFNQAYFFAAVIIGGDKHEPAKADLLLKRGIEACPEEWYIPYIAGFNQYLFAKNERQCAIYYRLAAGLPKAPGWLSNQAEIIQAHIPAFIKSINIWQKIFDSSDDIAVKQEAREKLCALWMHIRNASPDGSLVQTRSSEELKKLGVKFFSLTPQR